MKTADGQIDRVRAGYWAAGISIVINILLFGLKYWAGLVTGSIAILADAWHSLTDSISSIVVVIAIFLSSRKADEKHPFGHGRWEQIAALFIGFILAIVAWDFLSSSIKLFGEHKSVHYGKIAIIATVISILVKEALAQYTFYIARKTKNLSLKADAWHHRSDSLSSIVVLVGIFVAKYFWWIDSVLGIIISLMLFYATYEIVKEAIHKLLGEDANEELINKVKKIISKNYPRDVDAHHFHIHNYSTHQELTFHIRLNPDYNIAHAHKIATDIELDILNEMNIHTTIHIEPLDYKCE
ncbi:MAG: cation diffusion facilitator family transporter [Bacteroidales bacterium]|nr:cation diffusion facilitator family transporter [Bacteroidales bacterium]